MKKVIMFALAIGMSLMFSGCSDRISPSVASAVAQLYDTTETFYVKGQEIVVINADLLDDSTIAKLNGINEVALLVDSTYTLLSADESERYEALEKEYKQIQEYLILHQSGPEYDNKMKKQEELGKLLQELNIKAIERHSDYLNKYHRVNKTLEVINR